MSSIKLEASELDLIEQNRYDYLSLTQRYGELSYDILLLQKSLRDIETKLAEVDSKRDEFTKVLVSKYGNGRVDLNTGTFIPDQLA
jgi:hypothetical protein